ncbi:MAG: orotate phosphoribosyltransferase [Alphaproteobacteria bacterium]|nr:orotate phosphoribosyltransferase [Alphaproteobacteria bacterium]
MTLDAAAAETAEILLNIKAALFNAQQPFTFTSGRKSPVYIDCRKIISFPAERRRLMTLLHQKLVRAAGPEAFDAVAGGETAGIAYAAWMSELMNVPMQYVRKQPKGFGRMAQIEGELSEGQRVLLMEDLATDGGSKEKFVTALRTAGAKVDHTAVIFFYGIYPKSTEVFHNLNIQLHYLCTWPDMLQFVKQKNYFDAATIASVEQFLASPEEWSRQHGGKDVA